MSATAHVSENEARAVAEEARESGWSKPSFAKELFLGRFRLDLIHPHPRPGVEDAERGTAFLDQLRDYCATLDGAVIEREARIPDAYIKGWADLGCFGIKIPREYGGLGLSQVTYNRALVLLGSVHPSVGALVSAHQSIGVPEPLKLSGTPEQKQAFLPRCARGAISAFLLTEPDVGSDPARLHSTAIPDGNSYVIDGVKLWTTNGVIAELLVVMARVPKSEGHRGGISAFVVEADSPGITVEQRNAFMGLRGIENGVTRLHQVRVPAGNLIGREGEGLKIALTTLNTGRLALPALNVGCAKWSLKIAREWSAERVQWGKPVGQHAAVASKIAFVAATTFALEAVLDLSGQMSDEGRNDIRIEAALAKLWASEIGYVVADELVQIRGGRGYETAQSLAARGERAVPAEQMLRDLRINRIFEGSSEIMHLLLAREAVDPQLTAAGRLADPEATLRVKAHAAAKAAPFFVQWLPKLATGRGQLPTAFSEFGDLAPHLRYVERTSRAMSASCVRAEMLRSDDPEQGTTAYELADAFCGRRGFVSSGSWTLCGTTPTTPTTGSREEYLTATTPGWKPACSISARAPAPGSRPGSPAHHRSRTSPAESTDSGRSLLRNRRRCDANTGERIGRGAKRFPGQGPMTGQGSRYEAPGSS